MTARIRFQTLWYVILPVAKSSIAMITLFYLVLHWNEFFRAMIYLNDPDKWPLQVVLRQFVVEGDKLSMVGVESMSNYTDASQISIKALKAGMINPDHRPTHRHLPDYFAFLYQRHHVRRSERLTGAMTMKIVKTLASALTGACYCARPPWRSRSRSGWYKKIY
ncbi:ABC transporter permease [Salmonella bongori]|nr:ABC transporter permease [Salmonella bongori]